jgi:hypothetical protein
VDGACSEWTSSRLTSTGRVKGQGLVTVAAAVSTHLERAYPANSKFTNDTLKSFPNDRIVEQVWAGGCAAGCGSGQRPNSNAAHGKFQQDGVGWDGMG